MPASTLPTPDWPAELRSDRLEQTALALTDSEFATLPWPAQSRVLRAIDDFAYRNRAPYLERMFRLQAVHDAQQRAWIALGAPAQWLGLQREALGNSPGLTKSGQRKAKVRFLSTYRGEANYEVLDGEMVGARVGVRPMVESFYREDWGNGKAWNMTHEVYLRDVVGSAGIVHRRGAPVTEDVLAAIEAEYEVNRLHDPSGSHGQLCTGEWKPEVGWSRREVQRQRPPADPDIPAPASPRMRA